MRSCLCVLGVHELVKEAEVYKAIMVQEDIHYKTNRNKVHGRVHMHRLVDPWQKIYGIYFYYFKFIY